MDGLSKSIGRFCKPFEFQQHIAQIVVSARLCSVKRYGFFNEINGCAAFSTLVQKHAKKMNRVGTTRCDIENSSVKHLSVFAIARLVHVYCNPERILQVQFRVFLPLHFYCIFILHSFEKFQNGFSK